mgnify:FL=1|tara:strand:- start:1353 stop:2081 length:729 start_codon:yes stop_codon:yes gene_type:complete
MEKFLNKDIELLEPDHKYILKAEPDLNFTSVTSITSQYFAPFDKDSIAKRLVETNVKYIGMTAEELIAQWDQARDFGTLVHNNIESYINNESYKDISEVRHAIKWMKKFKNLSEFIFYPEVIIYSKELGIAGSIDVLAKDIKNDTYIIIDWKTSKSISKSSYGGRKGIHPITSHLMDCKYVHYSMQLSLYRYLIEEFYGIEISNLLIAHLNGNECKPIVADYYKKEVLDMVKEHKKTLNSMN